jgi:hypothetical protein
VEPQFVSTADPIPDSEIPAWAQGIDETLPVDMPLPAAGPQRWLIIYFQRSGDDNNDRRRLRRVHGVLTQYPGKDRFSIVIEGPDRNETFEFPNHTTGYCEELLRDLVSLVGDERNVEVFDPPTDVF